MKKKLKNQSGLSTLFLVFVIASVLALIILTLQMYSLLAARRAAQVQYSQEAFFAAEGAIYETIQHMRDDPFWPDFPAGDVHTTEYYIGNIKITRTITKLDGELEIDITATIKGTKRRLMATFGRGEEERRPLDIVLVIDRSGSMKGQPLVHAKDAALTFVDIIESEGAGDRIGLISYSDSARNDQELTEEYDEVRGSPPPVPRGIRGLTAQDHTNIGDAIYKAVEELEINGRTEAVKVIVLLSDGVANRDHDFVCSGCPDWPCLNLGSGFEPDNSGNCCTDDAVNQAETAKSEDYVIFSILLNNIYQSECGDLSSTEDLGRLTLLRASNEPSNRPLPAEGETYTYYKETKESAELENIYEEIAHVITSGEFFEIREELPEPEPD